MENKANLLQIHYWKIGAQDEGKLNGMICLSTLHEHILFKLITKEELLLLFIILNKERRKTKMIVVIQRENEEVWKRGNSFSGKTLSELITRWPKIRTSNITVEKKL